MFKKPYLFVCQIIPGSHKCGRIDHKHVGAQTGADLERVEAILNFPGNELVYVELDPGDALFFHCNLLHKSEVSGITIFMAHLF